jgi:hypothetical protein
VSLSLERQETLDADELVGFAARLAAEPHRWQHLCVGQRSAARVYAEIWSDACVNAWAICWFADVDTGFHDHDDSAAGIVVVEGSVVEERLALAGPCLTRRFRAGQGLHLPACAIHRVRHSGVEPAVTVHAYSPPLRRQGVYRTAPDGTLERDATPFTQALSAPSRSPASRSSNAGSRHRSVR